MAKAQSELEFQQLRNEIILQLSNLTVQPFWLAKTSEKRIGNIQPIFDLFCLDHLFQSEANEFIGLAFRNETEAVAVASVSAVLNYIIEMKGYWTKYEDYVDDPVLILLTDVAQRALNVMHETDEGAQVGQPKK